MNPLSYLKPAIESVLEAGKIVLEIYNSEFQVYDKGGNDPVTEADMRAGKWITERLAFTEIPVLSEEDSEKKDISQSPAAWILDPIDGTREFVHKNPEFAISLGLSVQGEARLGVVYNPVTRELVYGETGSGVVYEIFDSPPESYSIEGVSFSRFLNDDFKQNEILISRTEEKEGLFRKAPLPAGWKLVSLGSIAYKLGLVAAGKSALSISLKPKNEWDICAGIALVRASGGSDLEIRSGRPYPFQSRSGRGEGLIAGHSKSLNSVWEAAGTYFRSELRDWS
ncbi:3'(2'),5'-bisphosphate nucleotidase CysQ [Leptospira ellisii]|uniref:3'(2'),5'-bisphosphate nucleotidase CysQ n=1 Tax=Leptospira ellisii TaxID=2023197 RepID=A0A2N0BFK3_9LEPT|nr:3'(2'),5'-bisphosphate nucleotidase CysQ [Leptospira ellisii]MDV6237077.1 3'(2'),5'-bisphosphate nucleotidase CysQ [Leptospira ellisii]PJZ91390.1 3'(2'),5'-bisphosphate nucleotidase CysQ [Leptospira ellisii]PKA02730.1 3'(2'),5'-bisphosphate nucleotidase CysQ [Leptospira ellisii]